MIEMMDLPVELKRNIVGHLFLPELINLGLSCREWDVLVSARRSREWTRYREMQIIEDDDPLEEFEDDIFKRYVFELALSVLDCPGIGIYVEELYASSVKGYVGSNPILSPADWPSDLSFTAEEVTLLKRRDRGVAKWVPDTCPSWERITKNPATQDELWERYWDLLPILLPMLPRLRVLHLVWDALTPASRLDDIIDRSGIPHIFQTIAEAAAQPRSPSLPRVPLASLEEVKFDRVPPEFIYPFMAQPSVKRVFLKRMDFQDLRRARKFERMTYPDWLPKSRAQFVSLRRSDTKVSDMQHLMDGLRGPCVLLNKISQSSDALSGSLATNPGAYRWQSIVIPHENASRQSYIIRYLSEAEINQGQGVIDHARLADAMEDDESLDFAAYWERFKDLLRPR